MTINIILIVCSFILKDWNAAELLSTVCLPSWPQLSALPWSTISTHACRRNGVSQPVGTSGCRTSLCRNVNLCHKFWTNCNNITFQRRGMQISLLYQAMAYHQFAIRYSLRRWCKAQTRHCSYQPHLVLHWAVHPDARTLRDSLHITKLYWFFHIELRPFLRPRIWVAHVIVLSWMLTRVLTDFVFNYSFILYESSKIWSFHSGNHEQCRLLGCYAMLLF
jgi:hypothetical protein